MIRPASGTIPVSSTVDDFYDLFEVERERRQRQLHERFTESTSAAVAALSPEEQRRIRKLFERNERQRSIPTDALLDEASRELFLKSFPQTSTPTYDAPILARELRLYIGRLPLRLRPVMTGACRGKSVPEIARRLGLKPSTVSSRHRSALRLLREWMAPRKYAPPTRAN